MLLANVVVRRFLCTSAVAIAALSSCGDDSERQETILKLRALGVEQTPVIAAPGSLVQLTFHFAGPKGLAITAAAYKDTAFRYGTTANITLVDAAPVEEVLGGLSHYTLRAQYTAPSDAATLATISAKGNARVRYGLKCTVTGDDETVIGDSLVYAPTAPQIAWKAPTIAINQPVTSTISTTTELAATITPDHDESNRVSWFVSSGKVKNRRSKSSEWSEASGGEQTLFLTTRGSKSGAFAIKAAKVTVN